MAKMMIINGKMVRVETAPVTSCDGCGQCCTHMGTPPGYAAFYPIDGVIPDSFKEFEDYQRWKNIPPDIESELRAYYDGVQSGTLIDRTIDFSGLDEVAQAIHDGRLVWASWKQERIAADAVPIPCLWYDEETRRCKHYEHRPEVCRDSIVPGDPACLATRQKFRIPLPLTQ